MKREHQIGVAVTCTFLCLTGAVIGLKMKNQPTPAKVEKSEPEKKVAAAAPQKSTEIKVPSMFEDSQTITIDAEVKDDKKKNPEQPPQKSPIPPIDKKDKQKEIDPIGDKFKKTDNTAGLSKNKSTDSLGKSTVVKQEEKVPVKVVKDDKSREKVMVDQKDDGKEKNKKDDSKEKNKKDEDKEKNKKDEDKQKNTDDKKKNDNIVGFPIVIGGSPTGESGKPPIGSAEKTPSKTPAEILLGGSDPKRPLVPSPTDAEKEKAKAAAEKAKPENPRPLYLSPLVSDDPTEDGKNQTSGQTAKALSSVDSSPKNPLYSTPSVPAKPVAKGTSEAPILLGSRGGADSTPRRVDSASTWPPLSSSPPPPPASSPPPPAPYKPLDNHPAPPPPPAAKPTPDGSYFVPDPPSAANTANRATPGLLPDPPPPSAPSPVASGLQTPATLPNLSAPPARVVPRVLEYTEQEYVCRAGDTFEILSDRYYQSPAYAGALRRHNQNHPRAGERMVREGVLTPGEKIFIPPADILEQRYADAIVKPPSTVPASYTTPTPRP